MQARPQHRVLEHHRWIRTFVIRAGQQHWWYTSLPFGWKYSPVICQRLVEGIVSSALRGYSATWHVYLDDVLPPPLV